MKIYSIAKVGKDYVVRASGRAVLAFTSRRRAARVVADATDLLSGSEARAGTGLPERRRLSSMPRDRPKVP